MCTVYLHLQCVSGIKLRTRNQAAYRRVSHSRVGPWLGGRYLVLPVAPTACSCAVAYPAFRARKLFVLQNAIRPVRYQSRFQSFHPNRDEWLLHSSHMNVTPLALDSPTPHTYTQLTV